MHDLTTHPEYQRNVAAMRRMGQLAQEAARPVLDVGIRVKEAAFIPPAMGTMLAANRAYIAGFGRLVSKGLD